MKPPLQLPTAPDGCIYYRDPLGRWWVSRTGRRPWLPLDFAVGRKLSWQGLW